MTNHDILGKFQGKRILITGGAGYLGSNIVDLLKGIKCQVLCLEPKKIVSMETGSVAQISNVIGDVRDPQTWQEALKEVDIVFHLAAQTSVYVANDKPIDDLELNVVPMLLMLEECRKNNHHPTIIFSGTVTEAGLPASLPVNESHPDCPITIYDLHKLMAENYLKYHVAQGVVSGAIMRLANVYGPGPQSSSADRGVLNMMIRKALKGDELTVYGKGDHIRDYVYIKDVAYAFLFAAAHIDKINGRHFVVGSEEGHSLAQAFGLVADRAGNITGKKVGVINVEPPASLSPIEDRDFIADSGKFKKATGWKIEHSLQNGIDLTIKSILTREDFCK